MTRYVLPLPCLLAMLLLVLASCTESDLIGPNDTEYPTLAKKPDGGGKPGGGPTNWALVGVRFSDVVLISSDGSTTKKIAKCRPDHCWSPRFTDDGTAVLYGEDGMLRMVGIDGKNDRTVVDPGYGSFDVLRGSTSIIAKGDGDIVVVDYETGELQELGLSSLIQGEGQLLDVSAGPDLDESAPGFQGSIVLAWGTWEDGEYDADIYVVKVADEDGTVTLDSTIVRFALPDVDGGQRFPEFSSDGTRIAFLDRAHCCSGDDLKVVDFNIDAWWNEDERAPELLFSPDVLIAIASPEITPYLQYIGRHPTWSPDGAWVAYHGIFFRTGVMYGELAILDPDYNPDVPDCPDPVYLSGNADVSEPDWNPAWVNDIDAGGC